MFGKKKIGSENKRQTMAGGDAKHITCWLYFTYLYTMLV